VWLWVGATMLQVIIYTTVITAVSGAVRDFLRPRAGA
jgi:hypothetical protein